MCPFDGGAWPIQEASRAIAGLHLHDNIAVHMHSAYICPMHANDHVHALAPLAGSDEPTVGDIKRALHELSHSPSDFATRDYARVLREVNELIRRCARLNGIDPDAAVNRRREAAQTQRERIVLAGDTAADRKSR